MKPRVSICVPNLNTRRFLPERFRTILDQTYQDWELLVYDSYSDDGAWEYIQELSVSEPRMRAWQGPREGTPGSWTPCVREARGEYVYIATSDDTMPPDCLERLVAALDAHPGCNLAHCCLLAVDERGSRAIDSEGSDVSDLYAQYGLFSVSSGGLLQRPHIRRAPFDGLLHLLGETVYTSITQLLIRRSLFDRIGLFESRWGPVGDFHWSMRAGLVADTVHVPDTWGGWRMHASQATAGARLGTAEHARRTESMIEDAIETCCRLLPPAVARRLQGEWAVQAKDFRSFDQEFGQHQPSLERKRLVVRRMFAGSIAAREHLKSRILHQRAWRESFPDRVRRWMEEASLGVAVVPLAAVVPGKNRTRSESSFEVKSTV
jgi:hypothetical protein